MAQSLNSLAYQNNPQFIPLARKYGFKSYESAFGKQEIKTRQDAYKAIAQDIWSADAIKVIAGGWSDEQEAKILKFGDAQVIDADGEESINPEATGWIVPCSINEYDIANAFRNSNIIEWTQRVSVKTDDLVYIYLSWPVCQIKYKCIIISSDLNWEQRQTDDLSFYKSDKLLERAKSKKFMRIRLIRIFDDGVLTFAQLKEAGNKSNFQGAMRVTDVIGNEIKKVESYNTKFSGD